MPLVKVPANDWPAAVDDCPAGSLAHLLTLLASPSGADRRAAVRGLDTHDEGIVPLCTRLAIEPATSVREAIVATLIRRRSTAVVTALLPLLRSDEAPQRNAALEALGAMPDEVAPHIEQLLHDADPDVRIFTANMLGVLPHPQAEAWLLTALADDHVNVCAAAIDGLAEIGGAAALPALRALPARFPDDSFIAFAAAVAVQRIDA